MNFLGMFKRAPAAGAKFPKGRVGFAVGDIHGRADLLAEMIALLETRAIEERRDGHEPIAVFLGDYVDRGPSSAAVIDLLVAGRPSGFERRFLRGNHEQAMLGFMEAPLENRAWVKHGGAETLVSYGVQPPPPSAALDQDLIAAAARLKDVLPPEHLDFLNNSERYVELGGYAFVHAGIDPGRSLDQQTDRDLFWIRDAFLTSKRAFSHRIVHGHTPEERPFADRRRVGVDTGAYASGVLSAARFEGEAVSFLSVSTLRAGRFPAPLA